MKQLRENEGIERSLLLTMAVIAGLTVANCYYNQPLLEMIRHDMGVSQHEANLITVVTQIGYALGLCFLIPMGDLYSRRRIIVINMSVAAVMAVFIAFSQRVWIVWLAYAFYRDEAVAHGHLHRIETDYLADGIGNIGCLHVLGNCEFLQFVVDEADFIALGSLVEVDENVRHAAVVIVALDVLCAHRQGERAQQEYDG